jgi:protein-S-isoprenylcysteine O-methyltransferase Ste14
MLTQKSEPASDVADEPARPLPLENLGREIDSPALQKLMTNFWFDKLCALVLAAQATLWIVDAVKNKRGIELILLLTSHTLFLGFSLVRATPTRVTTNPVYWVIELIAGTTWIFYGLFRDRPAIALAPEWLTQTLAFSGTAILVIARLSLWRSFGYLPAQRELVSRGAYAVVRHPIYIALLLHGIAYLLAAYNLANVFVVLVGAVFFLLKALVEEAFLARSPEYRAYMKKVRWRYVPFVF